MWQVGNLDREVSTIFLCQPWTYTLSSTFDGMLTEEFATPQVMVWLLINCQIEAWQAWINYVTLIVIWLYLCVFIQYQVFQGYLVCCTTINIGDPFIFASIYFFAEFQCHQYYTFYSYRTHKHRNRSSTRSPKDLSLAWAKYKGHQYKGVYSILMITIV